MDVLGMLAGLKDKVLDAGHYEILRHAYELQNDNIEQLKTNNEALKESNGLLKERASHLQKELDSLKAQVAELQKSLPAQMSGYEPQGVAREILKLFQGSGKTSLYEYDFERQISCSEIQLSAGLRELSDNKLVACRVISPDKGGKYSLTAEGEKLVLSGID